MTFKLVEQTDTHMCRPQFAMHREPHLYPSESSVGFLDDYGTKRIDGTCLRRVYYRYTGEGDASPPSPYSQWIFALGKAVEEILVEQWKQMGLWIGNNVKFYDKKRNVSGELDCILRDPETGKLFFAEVKSFYGYQATKEIVGNKSQKGKPKLSQLLQTLIYVDQTEGQLDHGRMIYYARDSAARAEFIITLTDDNGIKRPTVDGEVDYRFTMDDVYNRYAEVMEFLNKQELPARDFEKNWSPEKIQTRKAMGEVSKSAFEKYQQSPKKNPIGDWQCRYCPWSSVCYGRDKDK